MKPRRLQSILRKNNATFSIIPVYSVFSVVNVLVKARKCRSDRETFLRDQEIFPQRLSFSLFPTRHQIVIMRALALS